MYKDEIIEKMGNILRYIVWICIAPMVMCCHSEVKSIISPDGNIKVNLITNEDSFLSPVYFAVQYKGRNILSKIEVGIQTQKQDFGSNIKLKRASETKYIKDDYMMVSGKRSHCVNEANERTYYLENDSKHIIEIVFRVYDDGVVFKYRLDNLNENDSLQKEYTAYHIPEGSKRWMQLYDVSYEQFFPMSKDGKSQDRAEAVLWGYPGLVELDSINSIYMLLTEANIRKGNCGSYLYNGDDRNKYQVSLGDEKLALGAAYESPWRVLIIGSLSEIVESTLVTDVSDPSKAEGEDWINPGVASWIYWANNHGSKDYQIVKDYIDLAAEMKWKYNLIDWEWDVMANGGNVQDAIRYAQEKGILPILWYNSSTNWIGPEPLFRLNEKENREKEYQWLRDMGVAGLKVDFFAGDGVATMDYCIALLEDALKYKLLMNFHGATLPRGWQRTYPNLMSIEGVYGAEWYNNAPILTNRAAVHNATLPFTRNVVGSMDYTPGTFSDSQHPHITTYAHELALPIIFESAIQHMPDRPSVYRELPSAVKGLLSGLPTAWDDTKLLSGYPGKYVILARRKGSVWYVGGINGFDEPRTLLLPLENLSVDGLSMTIFKDGETDRTFAIEKGVVISKDMQHIEVSCLPRGGFVAIIQ